MKIQKKITPLFICASFTSYFLNCPTFVSSFAPHHHNHHHHHQTTPSSTSPSSLYSEPPASRNELSVILEPKLTDERTKSLFAWISQAFGGNDEYNNLMLAMAAVFGVNLPPNSMPLQLIERAKKLLPQDEEQTTGAPIPLYEREEASLGAMGAGQWTGQWKTRPHALLDVTNVTSIDQWKQTLPRGCKRTLKKANAQNFTVVTRPIRGSKPAPHSSLSHFRCVVEHEVRLIAGENGIYGDYGDDNNISAFFDALSEAVSRYIGTTRMTGEIQEYKNEEGRIIAFAHEVRKGKTVRGQWFYCTDEGSKKYVWFHSVQQLVQRAIDTDGVNTVDLGPSGTDSFSELKARYGFESVDDWPAVADYTGPFYYDGDDIEDEEDGDERNRLMSLLRMLGK